MHILSSSEARKNSAWEFQWSSRLIGVGSFTLPRDISGCFHAFASASREPYFLIPQS